MRDRRIKGRWCAAHKTSDVRIDTQCAYCRHPLHFHEGTILLAKRGNVQHVPCPHCGRSNLLLVARTGKRCELAMEDQGGLVIQLTLDGKSH